MSGRNSEIYGRSAFNKKSVLSYTNSIGTPKASNVNIRSNGETSVITFDDVCLCDIQGNNFYVNTPQSITANVNNSGANGLQSNLTPQKATLYYLWLISDGISVKSFFSDAYLAQNLIAPTGYKFFCRIGAVCTNLTLLTGKQQLFSSIQVGNEFTFIANTLDAEWLNSLTTKGSQIITPSGMQEVKLYGVPVKTVKSLKISIGHYSGSLGYIVAPTIDWPVAPSYYLYSADAESGDVSPTNRIVTMPCLTKSINTCSIFASGKGNTCKIWLNGWFDNL